MTSQGRMVNHTVSGDGLMLHAEQFRLRTNSDAEGDCHDYIGFFSDISTFPCEVFSKFY